MTNRFYLACFRDCVGNNVSFHCKDGKGYSTNIDKAHVFTLQEAQHEWETGREFDQPISADIVDSLARWCVDSQYIPTKSDLTDPSDRYVAYQKGMWDGNDVYWLNTEALEIHTDFSKASIIGKEQAQRIEHSYISVPFHLADKVKRRTFDKRLFNLQQMVLVQGLKKPAAASKKKKPNSGKTRFNCPSCGRFKFQFDPHQFHGCTNIDCKEWSITA